MFVDKVQIHLTAGQGGDGYVSFRQEKFVDKGGPDGGDGGDGGSIVIVGSTREHTLSRFRHDKDLVAEPGLNGFKQNRHGRRGHDLEVFVPVGTVVIRQSDQAVVADITEPEQRVIIARGGRGGFGNAHFVSSVRQAPRVAEKGEPGDEYDAVLELKSIADVGIIGLPNAGKSTLLSVISNARPEIANYPFTTIRPNLGVVMVDDRQLVFADIPGLIEGASQGKGLGDDFLRHVERTKVLLHLIDAYGNDVAADYQVIRNELAAYSPQLAERPEVVALSKTEGFDAELLEHQLSELRAVVPVGTVVTSFSAAAKTGLIELLRQVADLVAAVPAEADDQPQTDRVVIRPQFDELDRWHIEQTADGWLLTGRRVERFARRTDFNNEDGVRRLRDIYRRMGVWRAMDKQGAAKGQQIIIGRPSVATMIY